MNGPIDPVTKMNRSIFSPYITFNMNSSNCEVVRA